MTEKSTDDELYSNRITGDGDALIGSAGVPTHIEESAKPVMNFIPEPAEAPEGGSGASDSADSGQSE